MKVLNIVIVTAMVVSVMTLTLAPAGGSQGINGAFCIRCGERGLADLILNILLFAPLGASLSRLGWSTHRVLIACVLASALIESLQLALPGRTPSARDVLANSLGGWLGASVLRRARYWARPSLLATNAFIALVLLAVTTVAATGWLLSGAPRGEQPLFGQWEPRFANMAHWAGQVRAVRHNGEPLPSQRLPAIPPALTSGPLSGPITIDVVIGPPPASLAPIFAIANISGDHLLLIGQDNNDLIVRVRRRSSLMRLNSPDVRFREALSGAKSGDSLALEVYGIEGPVPCVMINGRGACSPVPAAGRGWALFIYRSHWSHLAVSALDSVMFVLLALPIGFLLLSVPRGMAGGGLLILTFCVPFAASISGLALPSFLEILGLGVGLAVGALLAARASSGRAPLRYARPPATSMPNGSS